METGETNEKRSHSKKQKTIRSAVKLFTTVLILFANCVSTEFKIHSIELERRETEHLRFHLVSDIDFLDKRECKGNKCLIRFEFYPIDTKNPKRRIRIDRSRDGITKEFPLDERGVTEQFDRALRGPAAVFTVFGFDDEDEEDKKIFSIGKKSDGTYEYILKIPMEDKESWNEPSLNDEYVTESYVLKEGTTYTFWGRIEGPTFFGYAKAYGIFPYFFWGIRSQLYRWEVTIPREIPSKNP